MDLPQMNDTVDKTGRGVHANALPHERGRVCRKGEVMGLIEGLFGWLFGCGLKDVQKTVETLRPNAEADAQRGADYQAAALKQFGAEFRQQRDLYDRIIDNPNRLPRPAMALGVLFLIGSAMVDPVWFASRMQGLALVPDPLWWLLGAIVSFYFGARYQVKGQAFQESLAATLARSPRVVRNIKAIRPLSAGSPGVADVGDDAKETPEALARSDNQAVADWAGD